MLEQPIPVDWNPTSPLLDERWRLCRKIGCLDSDKLGPGPTLLCAPLLLRRALTDRHKMMQLRDLLAQGSPPWPVCNMSDYQVFQQVSELLKSGRFHLHAKSQPRGGPVGWRRQEKVDDLTEYVASPPARPEPAMEPPTFLSNSDGSAQAAALKGAAASGAPFCAACEAARLARQTGA